MQPAADQRKQNKEIITQTRPTVSGETQEEDETNFMNESYLWNLHASISVERRWQEIENGARRKTFKAKENQTRKSQNVVQMSDKVVYGWKEVQTGRTR